MIEKDKKLEEAIRTIEEAGGFVMMNNDESDVSHLVSDEEVQKAIHKKEYEERKEECFEEFQEILGNKNFSMTKVDNLLYSYGVDLDDLEEFIHRSF